jgi:Magnesium chelatase, subunit ChlI
LHRHSRRSKWLLRRAASLGSSSSVFRVSASRAAHSQDKGPLSAVGPARAGRPAALGRPGQARSPPGTRPVMMGDVANYSNFCFPHLLESGRTYYACGSEGDRSVIALRLKVDPAEATHDHTRQLLEPLPGRPAVVTTRLLRAPPHTDSALGRIGGGQLPMPKEVSLAHHGILCLDELPECTRHVLDVLRQPLEEGVVTITRASMLASGLIRRPHQYTSEC